MTRKLTENLFLLAGVSNIVGVLLFSRLFTNKTMMEAQPAVMGAFGLLCIILWGAAYIAVRATYDQVRWLIAVFVIEKLAYVIAWMMFLAGNSLADLYQADLFAGIFYSIYGANDFVFMLFFAYIFLTAGKRAS